MKIALLLHKYFPYGGLQRDCLRAGTKMSESGHDVSIITRTWEGERPEGVKVICLGKRGWSNLAMDKNFDLDVREWLKSKQFDRVVGFSRIAVKMDCYYAADPCYLERISRTKSCFYKLGARYRYMSGLEKSIFESGSLSRILLLTNMELADYEKHYGLEPERVCIIPPSIVRRDIDVERKSKLRAEVRSRVGWEDTKSVVLFVGSGFKTKGLDRAIRALAAVNSGLELYVVGAGKTSRYRRLASRLGVQERVHFMGARDDAWELMVAADVLIHPARSENTGTVLVEAISAGSAVISTDRCGFSNHVIGSSAGCVLSSPFQQSSLNEALADALEKPWQIAAEKALEYALTEDLYSGMNTAVRGMLSQS